MSNDLNSFSVVGRITQTPELKYTKTGTALCTLSIASGDKRSKDAEEWTNFFECNLWGKQAEGLHPYMVKGQQLAIIGRLKQDRWENDGNKRSKIIVNVERLHFLARPKDDGSIPLANGQKPQQQDSFEDDIPF